MTRRIIPHGPDAALDATVLALGEIAIAEATGRPRFGDGGTAGGKVGALVDDVIVKADQVDLDAAVARVALVEGTVTTGRLGYATWTELAANTTAPNNSLAEVPTSDTGTHTDPVVGGTVPNTGVFRRAALGWQRIYAVDAAAAAGFNTQAQAAAAASAAAAATAEKGMVPFAIGGDLPGGAPANFGTWLIPPPNGSIAPVSDTNLTQRGVQNGVTLQPGQQVAIQLSYPRPFFNGDYMLGSVIIVKQGTAVYPTKSGGTEFITVGNIPTSGAQQGFVESVPANVLVKEDINANIRRYVIGGQLTTLGNTLNASYLFVQNTGSAPIVVCGFGLGANARYHSDINYRDYDPAKAGNHEQRLVAVETKAASGVVDAIPSGGNLPGGAPKYGGAWLIPPTVVAATDPALLQLGVAYEAQIGSGDGGAYFRVNLDTATQVYGNGDYVVGSVLIRKSSADAWSMLATDMMSISTIQTDGGQPQSIAPSNGAILKFEDITANIRRYWIVGHYTALTAPISWFILFPHAVSGKTVWFSGFALGLSHVSISDVNWSEWDRLRVAGLTSRVAALEAGGGSTVQPTPDLLVQSSYHTIQGRPLRLYREGLTSYREQSIYDIAALGLNGSRVGEEWADPMMKIDGSEFVGAGFFRAKARQADNTTVYETPTTFYSSAATKTGSPKPLQIGDSLSNNGMISALSAKLAAAGVTPTFMGSLADAGGTLGEGRPNWLATNFTYAAKKPNNPGTGMLYDVFPLRPNGGSGVSINATISGGVVTSAAATGGTGYPNGVWEVVFANQGDNLAGSRRARGRITVSGGVPGAIVIDDGGAGYTGSVTGTITASYAEYLAMGNSGSYGPRWIYNPFVRPATTAEINAADPRIQNGYIYDFQHYVTNILAGVLPTHVIICLGMNDLWGGGGTPATAFGAIRQIVTAIRLVSATIPIAIAIPGQAKVEIWSQFVALTKMLMGQYKGQEASNNYILPLFSATDAKFVFTMNTPTATDAQTGQSTTGIADPTHPDAVGRSQQAEMTFAWLMCRLP